ncbi:SNF2 family N-terminal domain-containing protein [Zopfochytrium polystomum]|nr:SNF2 family N-terminal domain-containing protein [Zopfochytrium polystomum]
MSATAIVPGCPLTGLPQSTAAAPSKVSEPRPQAPPTSGATIAGDEANTEAPDLLCSNAHIGSLHIFWPATSPSAKLGIPALSPQSPRSRTLFRSIDIGVVREGSLTAFLIIAVDDGTILFNSALPDSTGAGELLEIVSTGITAGYCIVEASFFGSNVDILGSRDDRPMIWAGTGKRCEGRPGDHLTLRVLLTPFAFGESTRWAVDPTRECNFPFFVSIFNAFFPDPQPGTDEHIADLLQICVPDACGLDFANLDCVQPHGLNSTLLPFQRRAVAWMLQREGANLEAVFPGALAVGRESLFQAVPSQKLAESVLVTSEGNRIAFNAFTGEARPASGSHSQLLDAFAVVNHIRGGILADEMGLGKTVEILSLILSHPRPEVAQIPGFDEQNELIRGRATLVISPKAILSQWLSETTLHTPGLKTVWFKGSFGNERTKLSTQELAECDIVFVSYDTLRKEIHAANEDSARSRRQSRKYDRVESPLSKIEWWRVCLDEAQMVEGVKTNTAEMALRLPRLNAWAVTGTPAPKSEWQDLFGLLIFLDAYPFTVQSVFSRLTRPEHRELRQGLFKNILHRNTKKLVSKDLQIPEQHQWVVRLHFSPFEKFYYHKVEASCMSALDSTKSGAKGDDARASRQGCLVQLRQLCCHPQVGEANRRSLGDSIGTIDEIQKRLYAQTLSEVLSTERSVYLTQMTLAQVYEHAEDFNVSLDIYRQVLDDVRCRIETFELDILEAPDDKDDTNDRAHPPGAGSSVLSSRRERLRFLQTSLRFSKEVEHAAIFFIASCYNSLQDEEKETLYYAEAEALRNQLLAKQRSAVVDAKTNMWRGMGRSVQAGLNAQGSGDWASPTLQVLEAQLAKWEMENEAIKLRQCRAELRAPDLKTSVKDIGRRFAVLANQWIVAVRWRLRLIHLLGTDLDTGLPSEGPAAPPLDGTEGQVLGKNRGDEFSTTMSVQTELNVLLDEYSYLLSDRRELLHGKGVMQPQRVFFGEKKELRATLIAARSEFTLGSENKDLAALIHFFKAEADLLATASPERTAATDVVTSYAIGLEAQLNLFGYLMRELDTFRTVANARIQYYFHLDRLSATVTAVDRPDDINNEIRNLTGQIERAKAKSEKVISELVFLKDLVRANARRAKHLPLAGGCVMCGTEFKDVSNVAPCNHSYCNGCAKKWVRRFHQCVYCKKTTNASEIQILSADQSRNRAPFDENIRPEPTIDFGLPILPADAVESIMKFKVNGSYGTKLDFLLRHLMFIKAEAKKERDAVVIDPNAGEHKPNPQHSGKSIVFSQWEAVLDLLEDGCRKHGISVVRLDGKSSSSKGKSEAARRFQTEPDIDVFMLNAKSQSSGLSLVQATNVFLVEPVVNLGIEMQAISRVHRIGQTRVTHVYRYMIADTIEERIVLFSKERRRQSNAGHGGGGSGDVAQTIFDVAGCFEQANQIGTIKSDEVEDEGIAWFLLGRNNSIPPAHSGQAETATAESAAL